MKQNLFSFFLSFWVHITFQYLGICRRKTVYVLLIFDEVQCSYSFLSFYGRVTSRSLLTSAICLYRWLFPNSVLLFLWETFPRLGWDWRLYLTDFCPTLKILFQISLTEKWHFGAKGLWANHLTFSFSHYSIQSRYPSDLDFFLCSTDCRL